MKVNVLVHNDLDGTSSLYLISKVFGKRNIFFIKTSYASLSKNFNKLVKDLRENKKDLLIVADLVLNEKDIKKIDLKGLESKLIWLDHHIWSEESKSFISKTGSLIIDVNTCAAGVVYNYFKENWKKFSNKFPFNDFDRELIEIICDFDLWKLNKEISWKLSLSLINYNLENYRKKLEKGIIWDDELEKLYLERSEKLEKLKEKIKKKGFFIESNNKKALFYFLNKDDLLFISHLYEKLKKEIDVLLLVGDTGKISIRSKFDIIKLAKSLGGGGHKNAAGAFIEFNNLEKKINKYLFKLNIFPKKGVLEKKIKDFLENVENEK